MRNFQKFWPLVKVDEATRTVFGVVTAERPDRDGEICHYNSTVPYYQDMREEFSKATDGKSIAPLRAMHQLIAAGVGKSIEFRTPDRQIAMGFKVVDDNEWKKVQEGVYTGFSQGGQYVKTWRAPYTDPNTHETQEYTFYTAKPGEISLVDSPCLKEARFEFVKADGNPEMRTFKKGEVSSVGDLPPLPAGGTRAVVPPPYGQTPGSGVTTDEKGIITPESKCSKCGASFKAVGTETLCPKCAAANIKARITLGMIKADELSLNDKRNLVDAAIRSKYIGAGPFDAVSPKGGYWCRDLYDDYAICEEYGGSGATWKIPYTIDDAGEVTLGEPVKVVQQYVEAGKAANDPARIGRLIKKALAKEALWCAECGAKLDTDDLDEGKCPECGADLTDPGNVTEDQPSSEDLQRVSKGALKAWAALRKESQKKTSRVAGEDLTSDCFAYVGDPDDTSTWKYPLKFSTEAKSKSHVRNALARWGQHKGIPSDKEAGVRAKIVAAAKKYGIEVSDEADKVLRAYQFLLEPDLSKAEQWPAQQLAEVHDTVEMIKAAAVEDGESASDLATLLQKSLQCLTTLVEQEVRELEQLQSAARTLAAKGDKTMEEWEQLQKIADEELAKARSAGDHLAALGALHRAHHAKALSFEKARLGSCSDIVSRALKALGTATSPGASSVVSASSDVASASISVGGGGPSGQSVEGGAQGAYPGAPHPHGKTLEAEDVQKMIDAGIAKAVEQSGDNMMKIFIAMFGKPEESPGAASGPAAGIGDRSAVVKSSGISVTHPAGTKEGDTGTAPTTPTVSEDDVKKAFNQSDVGAQLKLAKLIKPGVPPPYLFAEGSPAAFLSGNR